MKLFKKTNNVLRKYNNIFKIFYEKRFKNSIKNLNFFDFFFLNYLNTKFLLLSFIKKIFGCVKFF